MQTVISLGVFLHYIALGIFLARVGLRATLLAYIFVFFYLVIAHLVLGLILSKDPTLFTPE